MSIEKDEIKFERLKRLDYLINKSKPRGAYWTDVDSFVDSLKQLEDDLPGKGEKYIHKLSYKEEECVYSEKFVEELLKKEFVELLKKEENLIEVRDQFGNVKYVKNNWR